MYTDDTGIQTDPIVSQTPIFDELSFERAKNLIWAELLKANTSINIPDSLLLPSQSRCTTNYSETVKIPREKPQKFKPPKSQIDLGPTPERNIQTEDIEKFELDITQELSFYKIPTSNEYDIIFEKIKDAKQISKPLKELAQIRSKSLPLLGIQKYANLVLEHTEKVINILKIKNTKKIDSYIAQSLTGLDIRLAGLWSYGKYSDLDSDMFNDIQLTFKIMEPRHCKYFSVFNSGIIQSKLINYGLALMPLEDMMKNAIINPYGYNNIVYINLKKSKEDDKFSFYILQDIDKSSKRRKWVMDCRLEEIALEMSTQLKKYTVELFRKIYFGIFKDNDYREDYYEKCQLCQYDLDQLLKNLVLCSRDLKFIKFFQGIIATEATYVPDEAVDRFNLFGDDFQQKRRFAEYEEKDPMEILSGLFDSNISMEQLVDLYRKFS